MWRREPIFWVHVLLGLSWCMQHASRVLGQTTRRHIPDSYLHFRHREVLKSHIILHLYSRAVQFQGSESFCRSLLSFTNQAFYVMRSFIVVMHFYSVSSLSWNLGTTQTCLWWKNSTIPGIWNPGDPNFAYLSCTGPSLNGEKKFDALRFRCRQVLL
jgi:hypothetical protein